MRRRTAAQRAAESEPTGVPLEGQYTHPADDAPPAREQSAFTMTYRLIEDLQRVRLAHGNRTRQVLPKIPGHVQPPRGLPSWDAFFKVSAETLETEEKRLLKLALKLCEDHPIGRWMLAQKGIGPALAVSILGELWPLEQFASVRKMWYYAGLAVTPEGTAVRRRKGVRANWNSRLKVRMYLFGVSVLKAGDSPWRTLYDTRKAYEIARAPILLDTPGMNAPGDDLETEPGAHTRADSPSVAAPGLGAPPSSDGPSSSAPEPVTAMSKRQIHYRALRVVEKALLKDLWRLAHGQEPLIGSPIPN